LCSVVLVVGCVVGVLDDDDELDDEDDDDDEDDELLLDELLDELLLDDVLVGGGPQGPPLRLNCPVQSSGSEAVASTGLTSSVRCR